MKTKNKIIIGVLAIILIGLFFIFLSGFNGNQKIIKIGGTLPLTGPLSMYGEAFRNGAIMAQEEINSNGGINGKKLEIVFQDNKGDAKTAVDDVTYMANTLNLPIIINSLEYITLATKEISEKSKKIMLTYTTYRLNEKDNPTYTFRDSWDMGFIGEYFGKSARKVGSTKVGILAQTDSSYSDFVTGFKTNFNGEVIEEIKFQYGQKDFRTELLKLKNLDIDTIVIYSFPVEANLIVKQMSELGIYNYRIISTELSEDSVTLGNEELLQKTNAITYLGKEENPENSLFIDKYKLRFNISPRPDSFFIYEDVKMLGKALELCGENTDCIKEEIQGNFDSNHNKYRKLPIVRYDYGWKLFELD